eukprot:scaffold137557_cov20-Tisochrysis_lutea.AAC.2
MASSAQPFTSMLDTKGGKREETVLQGKRVIRKLKGLQRGNGLAAPIAEARMLIRKPVFNWQGQLIKLNHCNLLALRTGRGQAPKP